jgi:peptidoglycan-associated lipoprotein
MAAPWQQQSRTLGLWLIVLTTVFGCTGRRVTTAVEDQAFLPGPSAAPVVEAAKVIPPAAVLPEPPKMEKMEPPTPAQREEPKIEAPPPPKPPAVEEVHAAEQPVTPPPPAPAPAPAVEEVHAAEQPVTSPPSAPAAPPSAEISDVYFDFDQFVIRSDARSLLEANATALKTQAARAILIEGHCDERGTSAYNLVLGERRAQAAARYLRDLGIPSSQIQITSYGKERPFCAEHSEACWQSNRRAHFTR